MTVLGVDKFSFPRNSVLATTDTMMGVGKYVTQHGGANPQEERSIWLKIEMNILFKTKCRSPAS